MKSIKYKCPRCNREFSVEFAVNDPVPNNFECGCDNLGTCANRVFGGMSISIDKEEDTVSFAIEKMKWAKGKI